MRSNPVARIIRNLLEAERKEKEHREWVKNLFVPVGLDLFGYAPLPQPREPMKPLAPLSPLVPLVPLAPKSKIISSANE